MGSLFEDFEDKEATELFNTDEIQEPVKEMPKINDEIAEPEENHHIFSEPEGDSLFDDDIIDYEEFERKPVEVKKIKHPNHIVEEVGNTANEEFMKWTGMDFNQIISRKMEVKRALTDIEKARNQISHRAAKLSFEGFDKETKIKEVPVITEYVTSSKHVYEVNWKEGTVSGEMIPGHTASFNNINDIYNFSTERHSVAGSKMEIVLNDGVVLKTAPVISAMDIEKERLGIFEQLDTERIQRENFVLDTKEGRSYVIDWDAKTLTGEEEGLIMFDVKAVTFHNSKDLIDRVSIESGDGKIFTTPVCTNIQTLKDYREELQKKEKEGIVITTQNLNKYIYNTKEHTLECEGKWGPVICIDAFIGEDECFHAMLEDGEVVKSSQILYKQDLEEYRQEKEELEKNKEKEIER